MPGQQLRLKIRALGTERVPERLVRRGEEVAPPPGHKESAAGAKHFPESLQPDHRIVEVLQSEGADDRILAHRRRVEAEYVGLDEPEVAKMLGPRPRARDPQQAG